MAEEKMTIVDLRKAIAKQIDTDEAAVGSFLNALFPAIAEGLKQDKQVRINGLGTFKLQWVEPRKSVNISTGEPILIEGYQKLSFTPEQSLKERVNEPYANLEPVQLDEDGNPLEVQPKHTPIDPLQKMDEQAMEIKDLLADLGADTTAPQEEPAAAEPEPVVVEEPKVEEPEPVVVEEPKAEEPAPVIVEEPKKEEPAPVIVEEPKKEEPAPVVTEEPKKEKPFRPWLVALITILVFCILLVCAYFFFIHKIEKWADMANSKIEAAQEEVQIEEEPILTDTVAAFEVDSLAQDSINALEADSVAAEIATEEEVINEPQATPDNEQSVTDSGMTGEFKELLCEEVVNEGSRLTWIAKKHYGHKEYWVYIYEANRDVLQKPSQLRIGMKLKLPKLPKDLMNFDSPETQRRLQELIDKYDPK